MNCRAQRLAAMSLATLALLMGTACHEECENAPEHPVGTKLRIWIGPSLTSSYVDSCANEDGLDDLGAEPLEVEVAHISDSHACTTREYLVPQNLPDSYVAHEEFIAREIADGTCVNYEMQLGSGSSGSTLLRSIGGSSSAPCTKPAFILCEDVFQVDFVEVVED